MQFCTVSRPLSLQGSSRVGLVCQVNRLERGDGAGFTCLPFRTTGKRNGLDIYSLTGNNRAAAEATPTIC